MNEKSFKIRSVMVAAGFLLWLAVAMLMNFSLAGPGREKYLEAGRKIALFTGEFYLPRARLLDKNGVPLAWSEKYFDLHWLSPLPPPPELLEQLETILPGIRQREFPPAGGPVILKWNLRPSQLLQLEELAGRRPELKIQTRLERIVISNPEIRRQLGEVVFEQNRQSGVSGLEKEFDAQLAGSPGAYEVMLDRYRNWIGSTWKLVREPAPGKDVRLDITIAEATAP